MQRVLQRPIIFLIGSLLLAGGVPSALANPLFVTGFEPLTYTLGDLDGQDGWQTDIGPKDRVRVRDDVPRVGDQALWSASGGGGVVDTRAIRDLSADMSDRMLTLSSRVIFTTGTRSDWEFSSVFGTLGYIGGLRVLGNDEFVLQTSLDSFATGVFIGGFQTIDLTFDFISGTASARRNGVQIASNVAFDASNSMLAQVAAVRLITPRVDAIALDEFRVTAVPEPAITALFALGLLGIGVARQRTSSREVS